LKRISGRNNFDLFSINGDVLIINNFDVAFKGSHGRVVLQQVVGLFNTTSIVDGNNVQKSVFTVIPASKKEAANTSKAINTNFDFSLANGFKLLCLSTSSNTYNWQTGGGRNRYAPQTNELTAEGGHAS